MNDDPIKCIFCQLPRRTIAFMPLKGNLEKFENLLETIDLEQYATKNLLICLSCNQFLNTYFEFKSNFLEKEDELLNYTNAENTADLFKVLVSKGLLDKDHDGEKLQICRMCYKATVYDDFTNVEYGSKFSTFLSTCIAEFDLFLINKTFICHPCLQILRSFYRFILKCIQAVKSETAYSLPLEKISQSEITSSGTVPKSNVEKIINLEPCNSTIDRPPDKKPKLDVDCEIIDIDGPTKLEVPSDKQQPIKSLNNDIKIVDVRKLLNPSNSITKNDDVIVVEPSELEMEERGRCKKVPAEASVRHQCFVCLALCSSDYLLTKHIKVLHANENNLTCFHCKSCFTSLKHLNLHVKSEHNLDLFQRHGKVISRFSDNKLTDDTKKPTKFCYECQICPVQYNSIDEINKHIASHLTEKIFTCWICQRVLIDTEVKNHFKLKHGTGLYKIIQEIDEFHIPTEESTQIVAKKIKTFECQICWRRIDNIVELHRHFATHINSETLLCFNCTFHCSDFQGMRNHLASKHGISSLYRITNKVGRKTNAQNNSLKETEPIDKTPINCPTCLKEYNTADDFIIHPCSKADNNKYCCAHCSSVLPTIDELDKHVCERTSENKQLDNRNTNKPPNENQHSKETKLYNCNLCQISFKTTQEVDNHNCTKDIKFVNSPDQLLSCGDCLGKFESYDELIGHICHKPELVLVQEELKIEEEDSSSTLTAASDTSVTKTENLTSEVIDIDSDSDSEFVEPNFHQETRIVEEICHVDMQEASQLISQGIPVVTPEYLEYQPLMMQMPPFNSVVDKEGMIMNRMNNGLPLMNSEAREHYMNSAGSEGRRVYLSNGNEENGVLGTQEMWPSVSNTTQNIRNSAIPNMSPLQALKNSVENIMPSVPLNTPRIVPTNNDYSLIISDDETENSQQNFSSTMSFVNTAIANNGQTREKPTNETNNYICISDDDEIQETDDHFMHQEQTTNEESAKVKRPPHAFIIYKEKLKPELEKKFPHIRPKDRMQMALDSWRRLSPTEKWPFTEEARLLRELFKREHPELCSSKTQRKRPAPKKPAEPEMPVMPQISAVFTLDAIPIVLD